MVNDIIPALINWFRVHENIVYLLAVFSLIGFVFAGVKKTRDIFAKLSYFVFNRKQNEQNKGNMDGNNPIEVAGWYFLPHDSAPRLPLCPDCFKNGNQQHMTKVKRSNWTRGMPLKWKYHCHECQKELEISPEIQDLLFLKLGERTDNHPTG